MYIYMDISQIMVKHILKYFTVSIHIPVTGDPEVNILKDLVIQLFLKIRSLGYVIYIETRLSCLLVAERFQGFWKNLREASSRGLHRLWLFVAIFSGVTIPKSLVCTTTVVLKMAQ